MAWLYLGIAGLLEIVWALGLKAAFTQPRGWIIGITVAAMVASFALLGLAMKQLPVRIRCLDRHRHHRHDDFRHALVWRAGHAGPAWLHRVDPGGCGRLEVLRRQPLNQLLNTGRQKNKKEYACSGKQLTRNSRMP